MFETRTSHGMQMVSKILMCVLCLSLMFLACNDEITIPEGALEEHVVDLRGDWNLKIVSQNSNDISDLLTFSDLQLRLEMDANGPTDYQIETAGLPFVVLVDGVWSFDDVTYPTSITFTTPDESVTVLLDRPPVSGGNYFSLSFSLGCGVNNYIYEFSKQ